MRLKREMNSLLMCERKGKASIPSNFTQRKQREQGRVHKNNKEGQNPFSMCEDEEEESYKEGMKG